MVICPFAPSGLAHGPKTYKAWYQWGPDFAEHIPSKLLADLLCSKFYGIVWARSCAAQLSLSHLLNMGLPMGHNTYLKLLLVLKEFYCPICRIVSTCAISWSFTHVTHMGLPMVGCPFNPFTLGHGFSPLEVLWNCLNLSFYSVVVMCLFDPYGSERISLKPLDRFSPFKFRRIVKICSFATS